MSVVCVTCNQKFETVPDDAVQITPDQRRVTSYRFADGSTHHLRYDASRGNSGKSLHTRWHQNKKKPECIHCYPPEPPVEQVEEVVQVAPVITQVLEAPPESQPKVESELTTTMAAPFRKFKS
jgi:hypothetical protein